MAKKCLGCAVCFPPICFLFQGFEDCLVFDELMEKFNNDLSKYHCYGLALQMNCGTISDAT